MRDVDDIPYTKFWKAYYAMEAIQAEESLAGIEVSSAPHLTKEYFNKTHARLERKAKEFLDVELKTMTPEELAYGIARKQLDGQ